MWLPGVHNSLVSEDKHLAEQIAQHWLLKAEPCPFMALSTENELADSFNSIRVQGTIYHG